MQASSPQEQEQLEELCRHFYYTRNPETRMSPRKKASLEKSLQKYLAKYEVAFLDDDQTLRISVPLDVIKKDVMEVFHSMKDIAKAFKNTELLTYFHDDAIRNTEKLIQISQIRIAGLEQRNADTTLQRQNLELGEEILRIHEDAMEREKRLREEWKS
ncbi:hypothetical protein FANTH_9999 [Fusarium anthophilum]|uniref:Uncharacterized protein n=1 Tax=Fusarium anthophilum TaxID=48485 RepID=A0A8H4Z4I7_9HYPO|nr:hypothetical protein FANTH_9999 [Fusarium anthophilum]